MNYFAGSYDVAVIGAGHAGIEAGLASARLGCKTAVFAINLDSVGNCPCNPSIGGTAKGHLVREVDALGGEMAKATDKTLIQIRMLNRGKGAAVQSLRAQIDRRAYQDYMKTVLEREQNLDLRQAEVTDIEKVGKNWQITTKLGAQFDCKCVVFATGTFLGGKIFIGDVSYEGGPDGLFPATELSKSLAKLNLPLRRFKTGTPCRVNSRSIDYSALEVQEGEENMLPISYQNGEKPHNKAVCYITYTNDKTKQVILDNIHLSPLYGGKIEGVGPRYCPSLEDKIVRFSDKERHQLFIEPCGLDTEEMYIQGASSSLPEQVQIEFYRTIKGLENCHIMRPAYAIEYDCVDPTSLKATLEFKEHEGLFGAGQFNGSSGYEEAAGQGIVAGINAALKAQGKAPFILERSSSYIGTLIDDLVTKGCTDPYRMITSRSEYRLLLRQDNADERLTPRGHQIGLVNDQAYSAFLERKALKEAEIERIKSIFVGPSEELNRFLVSRETTPINNGVRLDELIKRPQLDYKSLAFIDKDRPSLSDEVIEKVEVEIKYEGYIKRQEAQIKELMRLEKKLIPEDVDYDSITGLREEAKEKLKKIRPLSLGQASSISGVNPADVTVLAIRISKGDYKND